MTWLNDVFHEIDQFNPITQIGKPIAEGVGGGVAGIGQGFSNLGEGVGEGLKGLGSGLGNLLNSPITLIAIAGVGILLLKK